MNPTTSFTPERCQEIYRRMAEAAAGKDLLACLVAMQQEQGIGQAEAEANARRCMEAVAIHTSLTEALSENTMAVADKFFARLAKLPRERQMDALYQILFGLTIHSDPAAEAAMARGDTPEALYGAWREAADPDRTAEELQEQIRQALAQYRLTPGLLRRLTKQMQGGTGCLAAAEALGEGGRNLKCLIAMDLWLRNRDSLTLECAAAQAATGVETQAVADALRRGVIARDVAKKILVILACAIMFFAILFCTTGLLDVFQGLEFYSLHGTLYSSHHAGYCSFFPGLNMFLSGILFSGAACLLVNLTNHAADLVGGITTRFSAMLRKPAAEEGLPEDLVDATQGDSLSGYIEPDLRSFITVDPVDGDDNFDPVFA